MKSHEAINDHRSSRRAPVSRHQHELGLKRNSGEAVMMRTLFRLSACARKQIIYVLVTNLTNPDSPDPQSGNQSLHALKHSLFRMNSLHRGQ
jgi:hypothetical protein